MQGLSIYYLNVYAGCSDTHMLLSSVVPADPLCYGPVIHVPQGSVRVGLVSSEKKPLLILRQSELSGPRLVDVRLFVFPFVVTHSL